MFKYDFVILYEHRNRELENATLLAMMLERKGYKVAIEFRRSGRILFQKAEVLIVPYFYNNKTVTDFVIQPFCHYKKVINLQYEQVFSMESEKLGVFMPKDEARKAHHIAWGNIPEELMLRNGVNKENIHKIGHISIDMNMQKYNDAFYKRNTIAKKYNLPNDKKWNLFISSFSFVGISDEEFKQLQILTDGDKEFYDFKRLSVCSQKEVLNWFERILSESDDIFIYRPHPQEIEDSRIKELVARYDNFFSISDFSIRQWIKVCDTLCTWFSTSIVDAYYANKPCAVLSPIRIPNNLQYSILCDQNSIVDYDGFKKFYQEGTLSLVDGNTITKYYCNTLEANTFEKLVGVCEDLYKQKKGYDFCKKYKYSRLEVIKIYIYKMLMSIAAIVDYSSIAPRKYRADIFHSHREMVKKFKEIRLHRKRFSRILKNEK
ncbi:MAG: hypothetical protein IJ065_11900 [Eubacterium sp.]|nr:hypothetical protein [Eubacterium sp.]